MPQSVDSYVKAFQCKKTETPEECEARKEARVEQLVKEGKLVALELVDETKVIE